MGKAPTYSLIVGTISAILFYLVFTFGLNFLFFFIPTLPIFWIGLSRKDTSGLHASLFATVILAVTASPAHAILYLFLLALPAFYMAHESLKHGKFADNIIWFPITVILTRLVTIFCFVLLGLTLYYAGDDGGLPGLTANYFSASIAELAKDMPADDIEIIESLVHNMSFLIFAVSGWMWLLSLYVHGWIINRELLRQEKHIRPSFRIAPFPPQNWLITLLLITAIASIFGGESLAFWGKSSLILLLVPHFLLGLALLHERTKKTENAGFLLFCLYFLIFILLWPAIFVATYGAYYHIKLLNKYLSGGGNSSNN